jgi:hypothetical protein
MDSAKKTEIEEGKEPIWSLTHSSISDQALELATIEEVLD